MGTDVAVREEGSKLVAVIRGPEYQSKFHAMLPPDVDQARFTEVLIRAIQEDPKLMEKSTDKTSLLLACQRAATDGLMPDKREGALVMYGNKVQWQPMIGGLRKKLAAAGFALIAECVHENDAFDFDLGDNPGITHKQPRLGTPRGDMIGAYAIATNLETGDKYREVMSLEELNAVAAISRAGNSGPWKGPFKGEMYRKTVAKRLIKSLPIDDRRLQEVIARDNEQFAFADTAPAKPSDAATRVQAAIRGTTAPTPAVEDDVIEGHAEDVTEEQEHGNGGSDF
jgi:recombinase, phage RecT family